MRHRRQRGDTCLLRWPHGFYQEVKPQFVAREQHWWTFLKRLIRRRPNNGRHNLRRVWAVEIGGLRRKVSHRRRNRTIPTSPFLLLLGHQSFFFTLFLRISSRITSSSSLRFCRMDLAGTLVFSLPSSSPTVLVPTWCACAGFSDMIQCVGLIFWSI